MDKRRYEDLLSIDPPKTPRIDVAELGAIGFTERTLLYGYDTERNSWHVYLQGDLIHLHHYSGSGAPGSVIQTLRHATEESWLIEDLIPNKRLYPAASDYMFCFLIRSRGAYLPWTTWDPEQHRRAMQRVPFYGAVAE